MPRKTMQSLANSAERDGAEVKPHKNGGYRIKAPGGGLIIVHSSPSEVTHYLQRLKKDFERAGLTWPL